MAQIIPFQGLCPNPALVQQIASPPYDVLDSDQARTMAKNNLHSFLHIIKPEIDLDPDRDPQSDIVYKKGAENLQRFQKEYKLIREEKPQLYLYRQTMGEHVQTGFVGCVPVDEYRQGIIKKHEHTRPDKVKDRIRLMEATKAQTGPVFLAFHHNTHMEELRQDVFATSEPVYDFIAYDDVRHQFYRIDKPHIAKIQAAFKDIGALYIADGHHRSEAAAEYCERQRNAQPNYTGDEPFNFFYAVIFPESDLKILPYNRICRDLNGHAPQEFLETVEKNFTIAEANEPFNGPGSPQTFGMYLENQWRILKPKQGLFNPRDAVERLDVAILQDYLLQPVLGIDDPRTNPRIDFVGGMDSIQDLTSKVDNREYKVAFALYPTAMRDVMDVADANKVMPPKSTWFEPKLLSGMAVHVLD